MIAFIITVALLAVVTQGTSWVPASGIHDKLPGGPNCQSYTWGNGNSYKQNVAGLADCKELCKNAPEAQGFECDAIIYKNSADRCWLRGPDCDNLDIDANDENKKGMLYAEFDQTAEWCLMDEFTSSETCMSEAEHATLTGSVSTLQDCKAFCALNEECEYFFFNSGNNCMLYTDCSTDNFRIPTNPGDTYGKGSCPVPGCTDTGADNYNAAATQDDGSCTYPVPGCTDTGADNYNAAATQDDGSCTYLTEEASCCTTWTTECYTTASEANNMHACKDCVAENCDGECNTAWWTQSGDLADTIECQECCQGYDHEVSWNCPAVTTTSAPAVPGCTDTGADNYNAAATQDDGSCTYPTTTEESSGPVCEDFNEKKPCKKETAAEGLQCTWYKHIDACKPNDWEPVCSDSIYQTKKVCTKMGCWWELNEKVCHNEQPACTDKWAEVAALKQKDGRVKHTGIFSTDDCLDKAKEIEAKGISYNLVKSKGVCVTYATTSFTVGVSDDADKVVWAYGCMLD